MRRPFAIFAALSTGLLSLLHGSRMQPMNSVTLTAPIATTAIQSNVSLTPLAAFISAQKALTQSPTLPSAHFNLADALERLGFMREARIEFEKAAALESDPTHGAEARQRARKLRTGDPLTALNASKRYIDATASSKSRAILKQYLPIHERTQRSSANMQVRLDRAAELFASGLTDRKILAATLSQIARALSPRDGIDLYMERYLTVGGLHQAHRDREAIAILRAFDDEILRTHGETGCMAQLVCEKAIQKIIRGVPGEALDLMYEAFQRGTARGDSRLSTLYANLAGQVRALGQKGVPRRATPYDKKSRHQEPRATTSTARTRLMRYGDALAGLQICQDLGLFDAGLTDLSETSLQRALRPNAAIVEYGTVGEQVVAFITYKADMQYVVLFRNVMEVKKAADTMRHADDEHFVGAAAQLYELMVLPFASMLDGASTVAFVTYPDLAGIPFGAFFDAQRGQFLIERFAVVNARSTHAAIVASHALNNPAGEEKVLAIAATDIDHERCPNTSVLPAARREAMSIATLSQCTRLLAGPDATAEAIQRQLVQNVIIHYAGHLVRRGSDVWMPLMPAAGRDGLSATEIAKLPMQNARVVVLAACRGAAPDEVDDVLPTMADAFLMAGVPAVIASSYDIDDNDAPATMKRLHTYLQAGDDAASALRKTTIDELSRGRGVPLSIRFMAIGGAASLTN